MLVEITKKHCIDADYASVLDCPLFRAIREQHSEFPLSSVGGSNIMDKSDKYYYFDCNSMFNRSIEEASQRTLNKEPFWNINSMEEILKGERESVILYIHTPEYDAQRKLKERINPAHLPVKLSHYETINDSSYN